MNPDKRNVTTVPESVDRQTEVSRRNLFRSATIIAGGVAVFAAGIGTSRAEVESCKMSLVAAGYQAKPKDGAQCDGCSLFQAPSSCKLVDGVISPTGWCRFYSKKS